MKSIYLLLCITLGTLASAGEYSSVQPLVKTTNGTVLGHPSRNRTDVLEFLGIPYAASPVGSLRFASPAPYNKSGAYIASNFVSLG